MENPVILKLSPLEQKMDEYPTRCNLHGNGDFFADLVTLLCSSRSCYQLFMYLQKQFYQQRKIIEEQIQKEREEYRKDLDRTLEEQNVRVLL